ncbi:MAG: HDOD domain-containing protein [Deltaproteobacteria bacterium]|nr:HDOD domain-containing protein [Deltaproteobacteria bacterium]
MKRRILFVDDEPQVLEGLRLRLHRQRSRWEMAFADGGKTALELLARAPVDVIVTDMRMPQVDGVALLKEVQRLYPRVVRIVLSGHAELQAALQAVPVAHQFLTKPSEPGTIENVIERACNLQTLVNDETVKRIVGQIDILPSLPKVYHQLLVALSTDAGSTAEVARILKQDMAIAAKTLQIVNSAFFRLSRSIVKIEEAVTYLGLNTIKHIVLAAEVFQNGHGRRPPAGLSLEELQDHAYLVGELAASFFKDQRAKEDAFVAGLLHDLGKLVLAMELPAAVEKVHAEMRSAGCSMHCAEERVLGVTHAEVGGYLLGIWGLPYPIIEAVANHHAPSRVDTKELGILAAVHLADGLANEVQGAPAGPAPQSVLDQTFLTRLGVVEQVDGWRELAERHVRNRGSAGS